MPTLQVSNLGLKFTEAVGNVGDEGEANCLTPQPGLPAPRPVLLLISLADNLATRTIVVTSGVVG